MDIIQKSNRAILLLLNERRFYGELLLNCRIILDYKNPDLPTAAITSRNGVPTILMNKDFIEPLTPRGMAAVYMHELDHLLFAHIHYNNRGKNIEGVFNTRVLENICMDGAINQDNPFIEEIKSHIDLKALSEMAKEPLLPKQTSKYYFDKIWENNKDSRDAMEDLIKKMAENGTLDDHDFKDAMGDAEVLGKMGVFTAVSKAIKSSSSSANGAGDIPQHAMDLIESIQSELSASWEDLFSNFVARTSSTDRRATRKKPNRRYEYLIPGHRKKKQLNLALCLDESGSMDATDLGKVIDQIEKLRDLVAVVHLIHADCEVVDVETFKKGEPIEYKRKASGGTAYGPAIQRAVELDVDAIVYFGDMDTADTPDDPNIPVLWVTTSNNHNKPGDFGEMIFVK